MNKEYSAKIQSFIVNYFQLRCGKPLWVASKFCCSEMTRYIGYIILNDLTSAKAYILKGNISKKLEHDVLIVRSGGEYIMIDPTVWQVFKNKKNIIMGKYKCMDDSIKAARQIYKGDWKISENLNQKTLKKEVPELTKVIDKIIDENCKQENI